MCNLLIAHVSKKWLRSQKILTRANTTHPLCKKPPLSPALRGSKGILTRISLVPETAALGYNDARAKGGIGPD
jgi:hypothetical protein